MRIVKRHAGGPENQVINFFRPKNILFINPNVSLYSLGTLTYIIHRHNTTCNSTPINYLISQNFTGNGTSSV